MVVAAAAGCPYSAPVPFPLQLPAEPGLNPTEGGTATRRVGSNPGGVTSRTAANPGGRTATKQRRRTNERGETKAGRGLGRGVKDAPPLRPCKGQGPERLGDSSRGPGEGGGGRDTAVRGRTVRGGNALGDSTLPQVAERIKKIARARRERREGWGGGGG